MCPNIQVLNTTTNGAIYWFKNCGMAQVIFKNLCFDFYLEEYDAFLKYLSSLDGDSIEKKYENSIHRRKIPIRMGKSCLTILLNKEELLELQFLFTGQDRLFILNNPTVQIEYQIGLN